MTIYDDMRAVASNLLAEFKQGVIDYVSVVVPEGAAPDEPGKPQTVKHRINATARPVATKYVDGTHIVQSDIQVVMPNDGIVPNMNGLMDIDGIRYKIIEVLKIPAAGTTVSFIVIVRR